MDEKTRAHVNITGRVQGVCFRIETQRAVAPLGVTGWVRNRSDGSVEAVFEGGASEVASAVAWCRRGPALARVQDVAVAYEPYTGEYGDFRVTY